MVTASQNESIIEVCRHWQEQLALYREKLDKLKTALYLFAPGKTDNTVLTKIEHFYNQFHIQIINIDDLKHEIRNNLHEAEKYPNIGHRIPHHYTKEKVDFTTCCTRYIGAGVQTFHTNLISLNPSAIVFTDRITYKYIS